MFLLSDSVKSALGKGSVCDLMHVLYFKNLVSTDYNFLTDNCKFFAARVFNATNGEGEVCTVGINADLPH